ncbi:MAG: aldo/keto reductase [Caldilineaceae bacterium]
MGKRTICSHRGSPHHPADHADIYGGGKSEEVRGWRWRARPSTVGRSCSSPGVRHPQGMFDFSRDHILSGQWRASLRRLQTDYLDVLLLHRPDTLVEPEEVADAFSQLHRAARCAISASAT